MDFPDAENRYSRREFAQLLNVSKRTLERWEASARLIPERDVVNNRPYYTDEHLKMIGRTIRHRSQTEQASIQSKLSQASRFLFPMMMVCIR